MNWYKLSELSYVKSDIDKETWIRKENNRNEEFEVDINIGKKTNLQKFKKNIIESIKKNLKEYKKSRTQLYKGELEKVETCPVCGNSSTNSTFIVDIYGAQYVECNECTHLYVKNRPTQKTIHDFYLNNVNYASTYTDKKSAEFRLKSIAVPWLKWTINVYKKKYGYAPKKILDVGSGAGHFVEAARRAGIQATGIELSQSSREFAKNVWGIELCGGNFLDKETYNKFIGYDIVTFWGLLEHTPNPGALLDVAYKIVSQSPHGGMVISKLPRWLSLSSAIQRLSTDTIIRHMDPMGHIMLFSDSSAAELYYLHNFKPVAAWYYGMDIYETLMQIGNKIDSYDHFVKTGELQMELQQFIDEMRFSDGLTLVGVPKK